jgi:outer membrane murein-binding lipoprotein Lpp
MSWFSRNELSDKASTLEQENDSLRADLQAAQTEAAKVPELTQEIASLKDDLESINGELATSETALADANKAKESAEESAKPEAIEAKALELVASAESPETIANAISAKASEMLAAAGHAPVEITETGESGDHTMTRKAFNALSPRAKSDFSKSGGKITA